MIWIGIDPGASGGIAFVGASGESGHWKMPGTEADVWAVLEQLGGHSERLCGLEKVHSMPSQGVTSTFTFGQGYGGLRMALTAAKIPFELVTPQKWQKAMGCLSKGDKNITKAAAQRLFPSVKVTHAIADALLIAEFLKRTHPR